MSAEATKFDMVVSRVFDAPVEQVWQVWQDPEQVKGWWGPLGFTAPLARMDFREGGTSLLCMRSPDGHDYYSTWTYSKIVPQQQLEFYHNFADKDGQRVEPATLGLLADLPQNVRHVITFQPLPGNKTELTITEYGYSTQQSHDLSKAGMEQCLDKMAASFSKD